MREAQSSSARVCVLLAVSEESHVSGDQLESSPVREAADALVLATEVRGVLGAGQVRQGHVVRVAVLSIAEMHVTTCNCIPNATESCWLWQKE